LAGGGVVYLPKNHPPPPPPQPELVTETTGPISLPACLHNQRQAGPKKVSAEDPK